MAPTVPPIATIVPPTATLVPPTATPIPKPDTPAATSCEIVKGNCLWLTFDSESCIYEGPTTLKAGPVTLLFLNESEGIAAVGLMRHTGDETIQDMIDYIGEEPSIGTSAPWVRHIPTWRDIDPGESHTWEGILEPGIHTMVCGIPEPGLFQHTIWFGGGFEVED
jgi:hypothetical protein